MMMLGSEMIATLVQPVGRKANWSETGLEEEKEGRLNEVTNHCVHRDSGQDWSDRDGTEISMLLWRKDFMNRLNVGLFLWRTPLRRC